ncbi:hypothetical protein [Burkholderia pyrrocinia]|uniref:hypothetical protein n=1 Tax=Burkholderia pyrrocinia TaxID=60550 RepID=UPI001BCF1095|nr:hypothetical protein [Burkholderia pyrrocinia]QVN22214.1 hypothetical protein JYG32_22895 [Burkholderia pyrrocinia]
MPGGAARTVSRDGSRAPACNPFTLRPANPANMTVPDRFFYPPDTYFTAWIRRPIGMRIRDFLYFRHFQIGARLISRQRQSK